MATPSRILGILSLQLRNIRGFRDLRLCFGESDLPPRRRTIFLGKNGTCKSTLLRSIAVGLADDIDATNLISQPLGGLIGKRSDEAHIELKLNDLTSPQSYDIWYEKPLWKRKDKEGLASDKPAERVPYTTRTAGPKVEGDGDESDGHDTFVFGVGAGRSVAAETGDTGRAYRISDSVASLFDYSSPLLDSELTLRRLKDFFGTARYERAKQGIQRVLGLEATDKIFLRPGGGVSVDSPTMGGEIALEGWADGYRLTLAWLLSLYGWAMRADAIDEEGHISGILLIDEIEQHLHPSLQAEILPRLSEFLPKMQIFATTHSPLVVLDAKPEEVVVLRREVDEIVADQHVPDFRGYSAEDVLTDPRLFDTPAHNLETQEKLAEYRALASIPQEERSRSERYRLLSLANEVRDSSRPGDDEDETSRLLKQLIAKHGL